MHVGLDLPNVEGRKVIAGHRLGWLGATVVTTTPNKGWHKTGRKTLEADVQEAHVTKASFWLTPPWIKKVDLIRSCSQPPTIPRSAMSKSTFLIEGVEGLQVGIVTKIPSS